MTINGLASANRTGTEGSARASADFYGVEDDIFNNTAEADAEIDIYSELDDGNVPVSGDITVSGELMVTAVVTETVGDLNITGNAIAHNAGAGSASASFFGISGAVLDDGPEADANLEIGGISFGHNVTVTGAITVDADATALGGDITITGHAIEQGLLLPAR